VTDRPGSTAALRQSNTQRVLTEVRTAGGLVQAEIARRTGLSAATVTNLVRALAEAHLVTVEEVVFHGRKAKLVTAAVEPGHVLGVDIGRSHIRVLLSDLAFAIAAEANTPLSPGASSDEGVALVAQLTEQVLAEPEHPYTRRLLAAIPGEGRLAPTTE
jgi:DNA-binding Lrp family transcriptional regulator